MTNKTRTERHIIKSSDDYFSLLLSFCKLSKNLYNHANYLVRQEFMQNKKLLKIRISVIWLVGLFIIFIKKLTILKRQQRMKIFPFHKKKTMLWRIWFPIAIFLINLLTIWSKNEWWRNDKVCVDNCS